MRPTLQSRLQGSFKHGKHRRFRSMIMHVCEFDFLSLPALDHEAMCVSGTPLERNSGCVKTEVFKTIICIRI